MPFRLVCKKEQKIKKRVNDDFTKYQVELNFEMFHTRTYPYLVVVRVVHQIPRYLYLYIYICYLIIMLQWRRPFTSSEEREREIEVVRLYNYKQYPSKLRS